MVHKLLLFWFQSSHKLSEGCYAFENPSTATTLCRRNNYYWPWFVVKNFYILWDFQKFVCKFVHQSIITEYEAKNEPDYGNHGFGLDGANSERRLASWPCFSIASTVIAFNDIWMRERGKKRKCCMDCCKVSALNQFPQNTLTHSLCSSRSVEHMDKYWV